MFFLLTDRRRWKTKLPNVKHLQLLKSQYGVQNQRRKRKLTRRAGSLPLLDLFLVIKIVMFDIFLRNNRFMYVRRPLIFVQKQYQWITH